jgi:quinohemoprotein amine dehydrogenase
VEGFDRNGALVLGGLGARAAHAESLPANDLLRTYCGGCHQEHGGRFDRISAIRKTPEGWVMTLARMRQVHGLALSDEVRDAVVRYLSDTQGLAPSESAAGRFALERRPNAQDLNLGPEMAVMCGRCHTLARASLQRRDERSGSNWRTPTWANGRRSNTRPPAATALGGKLPAAPCPHN